MAADRHDRAPLCFRPAEDDERWLRQLAAGTGSSVNAVLSAALACYRAAVEQEKEISR